MGKTFKEDHLAKCPFYMGDHDACIRCEGLIGTTCVNNFENRKELINHMEDFCRSQYKACVLYQLLIENNYDKEI